MAPRSTRILHLLTFISALLIPNWIHCYNVFVPSLLLCLLIFSLEVEFLVSVPIFRVTVPYSSFILITMKAQCDIMSPKHEILKGRVGRGDRDVTHEEMQNLLSKLKNLVPNMPRNKKLSKLEIIQYVIDYILDLQIALETHPATSRPTAAVLGMSPNRQPLGVLSPAINTCAAQEVNQTEKIPIIAEVIAAKRPVSC